MGIKGLVSDTDGRAIAGAMVKVKGNGKKIKISKRGEYWKILTPGNYTIVSRLVGPAIFRQVAQSCLKFIIRFLVL